MNSNCLPYAPLNTVKTVTVSEVVELGDDGGFRKPDLLFDSITFRSESSVGPSWYLDHQT